METDSGFETPKAVRYISVTMSGNGNDVYNLADGWLELDSDPGLFTLLLQDFGVQGVQVRDDDVHNT